MTGRFDPDDPSRWNAMTSTPNAAPTVAGAVDLVPVAPLTPETAVEMTRPWTAQTDFHRRLEISHSTRDSHISTAASFYRRMRIDARRTTNPRTVPQGSGRRTLDTSPMVRAR